MKSKTAPAALLDSAKQKVTHNIPLQLGASQPHAPSLVPSGVWAAALSSGMFGQNNRAYSLAGALEVISK